MSNTTPSPEQIKADDLIYQFQQYCELHGSKPGEAAYSSKVLRENAKQCAIIAVKMVISEIEKVGGFNVEMEDDNGISCSPMERKAYWESVLSSLEKM